MVTRRSESMRVANDIGSRAGGACPVPDSPQDLERLPSVIDQGVTETTARLLVDKMDQLAAAIDRLSGTVGVAVGPGQVSDYEINAVLGGVDAIIAYNKQHRVPRKRGARKGGKL